MVVRGSFLLPVIVQSDNSLIAGMLCQQLGSYSTGECSDAEGCRASFCFGDLTMLLVLCSITTIAQTLAQLPALKFVDLGYDQLEGPLDTACGLAATKKLQQLNLMNNALTGNIPACITQLPQMVEMHLDYNMLTGAIPAFPSSNSPLVYFTAAYQVRPDLMPPCVRVHDAGRIRIDFCVAWIAWCLGGAV